MAFTARPIGDISRSIRAEFRAALPGTDPAIWPNNLYVVSKVFAALVHGVELRLEQLEKAAHASLADKDALERHAQDRGVVRAASLRSAGTVTATISKNNILIPAGTRLKRSDGLVFVTLNDVEPEDDVTTATLSVEAELTGKKYNTESGATLTLETDINGVDAIAVDTTGIRGGTDQENDASLRARLLLKMRNPPHGGSPAEYKDWCFELAGVTRVFVRRATPQPGSVTIIFMMDDIYSDGIPLSADVTALEAILAERAPADADVNVVAPIASPVNISIASLEVDSPAVRSAITKEIKQMFRRRSEPGSASSDPGPFTFSKSWISEAISIAVGENRHVLVAPADDIAIGEHASGVPLIATVGTITFA